MTPSNFIFDKMTLATVWEMSGGKVGAGQGGGETTKVEARRLSRRLWKITRTREDGGLDQDVNSGDGENWSESHYILELGGKDLQSD